MIGYARTCAGCRKLFGTLCAAILQRRCYSGIPLAEAAKQLKESRSILVMAGAGLSTASGIQDFRSPGTGLYYNLQQYNLPYPEAIFDLGFFARDPRPFITLAKELYPGVKYSPNIGHYLVRLLHEKGMLLRMYTQNIDGLERLAGIPGNKLVEAHGAFSTASCIKCNRQHDPVKTRSLILEEKVVYCDHCKGLVKPDIVFFGEAMPDRFFLYQEDALYADLLIVMGTSLEVYPFAAIAEEVSYNVPRILFNREVVGTMGMRAKDAIFTGDITENITLLLKTLGWYEELQKLQKENSK
ncbi:NAD-dependent protein deacetylase Sirt2 [Gryllus bimaculatus]|nr:NAD-dependent protein deacetylase Sirt2 [Gryllus bimaculatus]